MNFVYFYSVCSLRDEILNKLMYQEYIGQVNIGLELVSVYDVIKLLSKLFGFYNFFFKLEYVGFVQNGK